MTRTVIHKLYAPFKAVLPGWLARPIRALATAFIAPLRFSWRSGHFRSSLKMAAVSQKGEPLPWYTYPAIDLLKNRQFGDRIILEFGGGQSTLWWAARSKQVITFEENKEWFEKISCKAPPNAEMHLVSMDSRSVNYQQVVEILNSRKTSKYDVIVIDGLFREEMTKVAREFLADNGVIICDNSEGYGFQEAFQGSEFKRVDFFGYAPGLVLPHCTSFYFRSSSFVFSPDYPIPDISQEQ